MYFSAAHNIFRNQRNIVFNDIYGKSGQACTGLQPSDIESIPGLALAINHFASMMKEKHPIGIK